MGGLETVHGASGRGVGEAVQDPLSVRRRAKGPPQEDSS